MLSTLNFVIWFFSAIYLVFILALSSISVLCTILVLNFNFGTEDYPISSTTRLLLVSVVARLICWKRQSCRSQRKVGDSTVELVEEFSSSSDDTGEKKEEQITWQDLSDILDKGFFMLFTIVILLSTAIFIAIIFSKRASE